MKLALEKDSRMGMWAQKSFPSWPSKVGPVQKKAVATKDYSLLLAKNKQQKKKEWPNTVLAKADQTGRKKWQISFYLAW